MKAIFISMQGALIEGSGSRCTLRCGAGAGLALLMDLDYRLIVVDGDDDDGVADIGAGSGVGDRADKQLYNGAGATADRRGNAHSPAEPARSPAPTRHAGHRPARLLPPVAAFWPQPGRLPDNGRRRRSSDPELLAGDGAGHVRQRAGLAHGPGADADADLIVDDGSDRCDRNRWSGVNTWDAGDSKSVGAAWTADTLWDDGLDARSDRGAEAGANPNWHAGPVWDAGANADAHKNGNGGMNGNAGKNGNGGMNGNAGKNGAAGMNGTAGKHRTAGESVAADTARANNDVRAYHGARANSRDRIAADMWQSARVGDTGNVWRTGPPPPNEAATSASGGDGGDGGDGGAPMPVPMPVATSQSPSTRASQIKDRLGDLLFRERLALQAYYRCCHADGAVRTAGRTAGHGAVHGAVNGAVNSIPAPWSVPYECHCLAPQPGLLLQAAFDHGIDLAASWMIGATLDDVEAGNRAGCRTVMIDSGLETSWRLGRSRVPTRIAPDLYTAALLIREEADRQAG